MNYSRDDFSEKTKRHLAERVAYRCSNPTCRKQTTGPHSVDEKSVRIGRAAHIHAAAPGGPRYSLDQSPTERSSIKNAIWLCANCADLIDKDPPSYQADLLSNWKYKAEAAALQELESSSHVPSDVRIRISKILYEGFDLLAGSEGAKRITGIQITSQVREKVRRIIEQCSDEAPGLEKITWLKACYFMAIGEVEKAYDLSVACPNIEEPERLLIQAQCLHRLGRAEKAIPVLLQILEIRDLEATVCYNLGLAYDDCGDTSEAKAYYERSLTADPAYAYPHSRLAKIAYESGDLDSALRHCQVACELETKDPMLWFRLALVLLNQENFEVALDVLETALKRFPTDSDLLGMKGRAIAQVGLLTEAENILRYATTLNPKNSTCWYNLAMCLAVQGRFEEGRNALQRAIETGYPDDGLMERFHKMEVIYNDHSDNHANPSQTF